MTSAPTSRDQAVRGILIANLLTLALAVLQDWSVLQLMWPFWMQSLIIGWYARQRMLKLTRFSTDGLTVNDRPVTPTPANQRRVANFFALHYGGFHVVYLFFLLAMSTTADTSGYIQVTNESTGQASPVHIGHVHPLDFIAYAVLALGFWRSHRASHREHVQADLGHSPNLGTLMFMPYARVIPMHLTLILAVLLGGSALWLFVLLKTGADVAMHKLEHRLLQQPRSASRSRGSAASSP
jgi:hypothetical protein